LFDWVNDPEIRVWSFSNALIERKEHARWFADSIKDPKIIILIFEVNASPAGMVRFERNNNVAVLNYLLDREFWGHGYGSQMLELALLEIDFVWTGVDVLAMTLPGNIASIKSLKKVGFVVKEVTATHCQYQRLHQSATGR
tara:strand:- start:50 stop:472 length:423 start_codon:yes stop_codon:yes gene_type:complete